MEPAFWRASWQDNRIGFHEGRPNAWLVAHHAQLAGCHRILVPLCGKTEDLAYLAERGHEVVGIELVSDAVEQFFAEHGITPTIERARELASYRAGSLTVIAGDLFAVTPAAVGAIDAIYDRAALVALPPELRARYVAQLRALAPAVRRELLVVLDYPEGAMNGPPFAVREPEVRLHFADARITVLGTAADPRGRLDGLLTEHCYALEWT